jgi:3-phenylpropionate/trans-cinnamate dioxygenase ferredoxin reductase subunit
MTGGVVIIGAGHAGGAAAGFLRQYGFDGPIALIGAEAYPPYQRPPLSKAWLKGEAELDDLYLRGDSFYADQGIVTRLNTQAMAIDHANRIVTLNDGEALPYDHLIIATGSRARPYPAPGAEKVPHHVLRTLDDAEALKNALRPGQHIGLIGAGYVGLEVAASARHLGCEVTIFEKEPRILARVASADLSGFFTDMHRARGAEIITGCSITELSLGDGDKKRVHLGDGSTRDFDLLLVGIGGLANTELAQGAGLDVSNGIVVDNEARTSDPDIFAIGDVTSRTLPFYEGRFRLESVPNALEQAKQAAAAITGHKPPVIETPWFWSDQYEFKLQIAGLLEAGTRAILRGDPASGAFSVFHLDARGRLRTAECVNRPADFMAAKLLIARGPALDEAVVRDPDAPLKPFLNAPPAA